jgi:hypothetical protein
MIVPLHQHHKFCYRKKWRNKSHSSFSSLSIMQKNVELQYAKKKKSDMPIKEHMYLILNNIA